MAGSKQQKKVFISWSGEISKEIAKGLKEVLESQIFKNCNFSCFVSDIDIASGTDWWNRIKSELQSCKIGILCMTKENLKAPWLYFESGALIAQDIPTIPLLFSCNINSLNDSPLKGKQCVDFYNEAKFINMLMNINEKLGLINIDKTQQKPIYDQGYSSLKKLLAPQLKNLKEKRLFNVSYIYPSNIDTITKKTLYISIPMSSISESDYAVYHKFASKLKKSLISIGFTANIICPMINIKDKTKFDGKTRAIKENFENLKQIESMVIIYPSNIPSSVLVELGYGIALSKKIVLFYKGELPYIVEKAGQTINHVKSFKYNDLDEINKTILENGMSLFEGDNDE